MRAEQAQHHRQLRRALGTRLDNLAKADLTARVDELTQAITELAATLADSDTENKALHARIIELEDDLAAARTSLRRMIRAENRTADERQRPVDHVVELAVVDVMAGLAVRAE